MGVEIERRFLVDQTKLPLSLNSHRIIQGYLNSAKERTVRVRIQDNREAYITIKGPSKNISRPEYEYSIPVNDALQMMELCESYIDKTRYKLPYGIDSEYMWEVDIFHGLNKGLIIAEIELDREDVELDFPSWLTKEISDDHRYSNSNLSVHPWSMWNEF
jgi:adenylate cyclase